MRGSLPLVLLIGVLLIGCDSGEPAATGPAVDPQPTPRADLGLPAGAEGATPWRDTGLPVTYDPEARHPSPELLLEAVADAFSEEADAEGPPPEVATEVLDVDGETASARVLVTGFADDSVLGVDHYLRLARDEAGWHVSATLTRDLCRRGESDGVCP